MSKKSSVSKEDQSPAVAEDAEDQLSETSSIASEDTEMSGKASKFKLTGKVSYIPYLGEDDKFRTFQESFMQLCEVEDIEEAFDEDFDCITKKEFKDELKIVYEDGKPKLKGDGTPETVEITKGTKERQ